MSDCYQGIVIPPNLQEDPCLGKRINSACVIHPDALTLLDIPSNTPVRDIINALVIALNSALNRIQDLEGNSTPQNPNDNGEISCSTPIQYLYASRAFFEANNSSISYQLADLDLQTIIDYWEDNCTKSVAYGGLFIQKCGSGLEVNDQLYSTGGDLVAVDGYYIADKALPDSGTAQYAGVEIHYRPTPGRPVEGFTPVYTQVFNQPCVIKIENSIITEVHNLTTTNFCSELP